MKSPNYKEQFFNNSLSPTVIFKSIDDLLIPIDANNSFFNLTLYNKGEIIGNKNIFSKLWYDKKERMKILNLLTNNDKIKDVISYINDKNNNKINIGLICISKYIKDTKIIFLTISNIGQRLALQKKITELAEVFNTFPNPICIADIIVKSNINLNSSLFEVEKQVQVVINNVNSAFENVTGFFASEIIGTNFLSGLFWSDIADAKNFGSNIITDKFLKDIVITLKRKDGNIFNAGAIVNPLKIKFGNVTKVQIMFSDISKRINYQKEIKKKNKDLVNKNRIINNLIRGITHKLGNYVMPILTYTDLWITKLKDKNFNLEKLTQSLINIKTNALEIKKFAESGVALSELENIRTVVNPEKINIHELIKISLRAFELNIKEKCIQCENLIDASSFVYGNKPQVREIFDNIIVNAIKYSENNGTLKILNKIDSNGFYKIYFIDTNPIIKKKYRSLIFQPYFRIKDFLDKKGSGIGLSVCNLLTQIHKGKLVVFPLKDTGNVFMVKLLSYDKGKKIWG